MRSKSVWICNNRDKIQITTVRRNMREYNFDYGWNSTNNILLSSKLIAKQYYGSIVFNVYSFML